MTIHCTVYHHAALQMNDTYVYNLQQCVPCRTVDVKRCVHATRTLSTSSIVHAVSAL